MISISKFSDTWRFWTWHRPKDQEDWKECERIIGLARKAKSFNIIITPRNIFAFRLDNWNNASEDSDSPENYDFEYDQYS